MVPLEQRFSQVLGAHQVQLVLLQARLDEALEENAKLREALKADTKEWKEAGKAE